MMKNGYILTRKIRTTSYFEGREHDGEDGQCDTEKDAKSIRRDGKDIGKSVLPDPKTDEAMVQYCVINDDEV